MQKIILSKKFYLKIDCFLNSYCKHLEFALFRDENGTETGVLDPSAIPNFEKYWKKFKEQTFQ
jgi:hypothetical protein